MHWGTLLPRHICWSYYYDPRCFRESPSNLAMFCVPGVMILATVLESIPWCHLVVGILLLGFWTRDSLYLPHVDSFARSFRLLVTFALVLEVRGISFFQILWTTYGSSLLDQKIITRVLSMSSPLYIVALPVLPFCMGYPEEICWTSFDMLNHASTTQKIVCSFELSLFSCLLTFVYQLIVKSMRAFVYRCLLLLWSVKPFYSGMTRRNKLQYLIHI